MKTLIRILLLSLAVGVGAAAAQPPAAPQEGFVPIDKLPTAEQLPAAPLLIGAYAFAWVAVLLYVWSVWRRLDRVERELREVARRLEPGARS
jgi:CcmD family protein